MLEKNFQSKLIKELKLRFPGCIVLKNDPELKPGIPDLLILYDEHWAALECKRENDASHQPLQDYYIMKMNMMSYASFIFPENKAEVLDELERSFTTRRSTRLPVSEQVSLDQLRPKEARGNI